MSVCSPVLRCGPHGGWSFRPGGYNNAEAEDWSVWRERRETCHVQSGKCNSWHVYVMVCICQIVIDIIRVLTS